jgi:hypothetical protein
MAGERGFPEERNTMGAVIFFWIDVGVLSERKMLFADQLMWSVDEALTCPIWVDSR